jgi:hypothetical protein
VRDQGKVTGDWTYRDSLSHDLKCKEGVKHDHCYCLGWHKMSCTSALLNRMCARFVIKLTTQLIQVLLVLYSMQQRPKAIGGEREGATQGDCVLTSSVGLWEGPLGRQVCNAETLL